METQEKSSTFMARNVKAGTKEGSMGEGITIPSQGLLGIEKVAEFLDVSPQTVMRLARKKQLRRVRVGKRVLFDLTDVRAFVERAKESNTE
jgi:excisionase family DNA binding protein